MAKTVKQYVADVVTQLQQDGKPILVTHKMLPAIAKHILNRPDVLMKLSVLLSKSKVYMKGYKGLRRSASFQIFGYKSFNELTKKVETDLSKFAKKQEGFDVNNNTFVIMLKKDDSSGDLGVDVAHGKSVALTYKKALDPKTKVSGSAYVVVAWGNEFIRPKEEKMAEVKLKINLRKENKRTPEKIKAELKRKAAAKIKHLNNALKTLNKKAAGIDADLEIIEGFADEFGVNGNITNRKLNNARSRAYNKFNENLAKAFSPEDIEVIKRARQYHLKGNIRAMHKALNELSNVDSYELAHEYVIKGLTPQQNIGYNDKLVDKQRNQLSRIKRLKAQLASDEELPKGLEAKNNRLIRKAKQKISQLNRYRDVLGEDSIDYSGRLQSRQALSAAIAKKQAQKLRIQQRLAEKLAKYGDDEVLTPAQQQIVKQQLVAQQVQKDSIKRRIERLLASRERQTARLTSDNSKVRGNAKFALKKIQDKLTGLGVDLGTAQQVAQQIVATQQVASNPQNIITPQNPRISKLLNRRQVWENKLAAAKTAKERGNINFTIRKINRQLQQLGVPSNVVNSQQVPAQMQVAPQLTAANDFVKKRIERLLASRQRQMSRLTSDNSKVRGNAKFALKRIQDKLTGIGVDFDTAQLAAQQIVQQKMQQVPQLVSVGNQKTTTDLSGLNLSKSERIAKLLGKLK